MSTEKPNGKTQAQNPVESSDLFGDWLLMSFCLWLGQPTKSVRLECRRSRKCRTIEPRMLQTLRPASACHRSKPCRPSETAKYETCKECRERTQMPRRVKARLVMFA